MSPTFSELRRRDVEIWQVAFYEKSQGWRLLSGGQASLSWPTWSVRGETIGQVMSSSLFGKKAPPVFSSRGPEEGFGKHIVLCC